MSNTFDRATAHQYIPIRRARQACVNCRRKKSKCPGEKPQCSTCKRLDQVCAYESWEPQSRKRLRSDMNDDGIDLGDEVSRRFGTIEEKLKELAASIPKPPLTSSTTTTATNSFTTNNISPTDPESHPISEGGHRIQQYAPEANPPSSLTANAQLIPSGLENLPPDVVQDGVVTYFKNFHAQPYSLMCHHITRGVMPLPTPVVLNPMLALSIRCSSHPFWKDQPRLTKCINDLTEKSWRDLLHMYGEGDVGLHYLQGVCLLAQVDFADGRVQRAHTQVSLGVRIAQSSGYLGDATSKIDHHTEEMVRCTWTLFMLDRTFSITRLVSPALSYQHFQLRKPTSAGGPSLKSIRQDPSVNAPSENESPTNDQDLTALVIGVYSIWDDVIKYVFQTATKNTTPPWHHGSELATIEYRFADFEPEFSTHRYREVDFPRRAIHEPDLRPYFASWLCFQLTYMSIQCCIHHPFIMFIKLQHVIQKVPPSFLQKSYKSSLIHSRWIIRFLDEMDEAGMMLYDPFIGHLTGIAATIQLEHTLSKHSDIAAAARLSFRNAIRFLRKLSKYWSSIQELLGIVEELAARLRHRHTLYYSQDDYDGILPAVETERVGLAEDDVTLMWKVFDYASMSASKGSSRASDGLSRFNLNYEEHFNRSEHVSGVLSGSRLPEVNLENGNSYNSLYSTPGISELQRTPGENPELPNLSLFDQLPEDWAFTIDDWTLFGAPGSTYFHNDGT